MPTYRRQFELRDTESYFIFGPRGVGKSSWIEANLNDTLIFDLLEDETYIALLSQPQSLEQRIPEKFKGWVVIDEIQKAPALLDEVHRLIEKRRFKFVLTGSSARKLRKQGANLLAGRALVKNMFALTAVELGKDFDLIRSLKWGHLPKACVSKNPKEFLQSYVKTYLQEEINQEGLTRNLPAFTRFLQAASFSQGSILNISAVSRECAVNRKVVEDYFSILRDTLVSHELPVFTKKAKRDLISAAKFYFFDVGVFQALRPRGPLDEENFAGIALESLVLQELRAQNQYCNWGFEIFYWHTRNHEEVDFVLYGERGLFAIEVKHTAKIRPDDLKSLRLFREDYPMAKCILLYAGRRTYTIDQINIVPVTQFLTNLQNWPEP